MRSFARALPRPLRNRLRAWRRRRIARPPRLGTLRLGDLRRLTPISSEWGFDRGLPVDRYYVESFLEAHREDVRGRVMEIGNDLYTRRFGSSIVRSDVVHLVEGNPRATIVADLTDAPQIPDDAFDCAIVTQTLQFIFDVPAALSTLHRILAPTGVLLASVPGISKVSRYDAEQWGGDYWRFTTQSIQHLLDRAFPGGRLEVESHGNVLAATAFLYGIGAGELRSEELETDDAVFPVTITMRVTKAP